MAVFVSSTKQIPDRIDVGSKDANPSRADVISHFDHGWKLKFFSELGVIYLTMTQIGWESGLGSESFKFMLMGKVEIFGYEGLVVMDVYYDAIDRHAIFTRRK